MTSLLTSHYLPGHILKSSFTSLQRFHRAPFASDCSSSLQCTVFLLHSEHEVSEDEFA